jgi:hypothetical protein
MDSIACNVSVTLRYPSGADVKPFLVPFWTCSNRLSMIGRRRCAELGAASLIPAILSADWHYVRCMNPPTRTVAQPKVIGLGTARESRAAKVTALGIRTKSEGVQREITPVDLCYYDTVINTEQACFARLATLLVLLPAVQSAEYWNVIGSHSTCKDDTVQLQATEACQARELQAPAS